MKKKRIRKLFRKTIKNVKNLLNNSEFRKRSKKSPRNFTRERKMGFVSIFKFILNLPRRPLQIELDDFHEDKTISKQAFSKSRHNIKPEAFKEISRVSSAAVLEGTKNGDDYRGLRVFSLDGSEFEIPPTEENIAYFGTHGSESACRARGSQLLHVSTNIIADAEIAPLSVDERTLALCHIDYFKQFSGDNDLIISDRGYPSKKFIKALEDNNFKYLMRLQRSFSKEIDENPSFDFRISLKYEKSILTIRVVRVVLDTGEIETLITNLPEGKFETACFKELYFLRWGIEGKYNSLKTNMLIELFSGTSRIAVEQDFYATICSSNLITLAKGCADEQIEEENSVKSLKHQYQANAKHAIAKVKKRLVLLLSVDDDNLRDRLFDDLISDIAQTRSEIRPNRHFLRPKDCHHRRKKRNKSVL